MNPSFDESYLSNRWGGCWPFSVRCQVNSCWLSFNLLGGWHVKNDLSCCLVTPFVSFVILLVKPSWICKNCLHHGCRLISRDGRALESTRPTRPGTTRLATSSSASQWPSSWYRRSGGATCMTRRKFLLFWFFSYYNVIRLSVTFDLLTKQLYW